MSEPTSSSGTDPTVVQPPPAPPPPPTFVPPPAPPAPPAAGDGGAAAPAAAPTVPAAGGDDGIQIEAWGWLQIVAPVLVLLGIFVEQDGANAWDGAEAWSVFAIACAVAQLAPLARRSFKWTQEKAWTIGAAAVAGLLAYWVLITLPSITRNTSFAITLGVAAATAAAWLAPGRRL